MPDIFLSYNREDQALARRFAEGFERAGFSVWWDVTLKSGEDYDKVTEKALREARAVVVLWSKRSVESRWVRAEATEAATLGTLVPVMIEPCKRPIMFELKQTAELGHWQGDAQDTAWQALLADVRSFVEKHSNTAASPALDPVRMPASHAATATGKTRLMLAGFAVAAIAVAVTMLLQGRDAATPANTDAATAVEGSVTATTATATPGANSTAAITLPRIVVLAFKDLSPGGDQQTFADGTSEEISNLLTTIPELVTIGQVSAEYFRNKQEDLEQMRERLDVDYVLTGSVRKNADDLRIGVQLINANDGRQVWNDNYDGTLSQSFEFQEAIAAAVANALQIKLGVGALASVLGMTNSVEAWEAFKKREKIPRTFDETFFREISLGFERALAIDPDYVAAAAQYIFALEVEYPAFRGSMTVADQRRASELRAHMAQSEAGRIALQLLELRTAMSRRDYLRAQTLFPAVDAAVKATGKEVPNFNYDNMQREILANSGQLQAALPYFEREYARDPLDREGIFFMAIAVAGAGDLPRAVALMRQAIATEGPPSAQLDGGLLVHLLAMKDTEALRQYFREHQWPALASSPPTDMDINQAMLSRLDDREAAVNWLRTNVPMAVNVPLTLSVAATWAAYWDEPQFALELQSAGARIGLLLPGFDIFRPNYAAMRKLPGFKQLVTDMGLVDYWRESGNWSDFCKPIPGNAADFECQ